MKEDEGQKRIAQLIEEIETHNRHYYTHDAPVISDERYDMLCKELEALEEAFPHLKRLDSPSQRVGGEPIKTFPTKAHRYPMLSLSNTYSLKEILDFTTRHSKFLEESNCEYLCELKFDGVAISLIYQDGLLTEALTRGDGIEGDEVTENVRTIRNVPLRVQDKTCPSRFEVRGEIFLPTYSFAQWNEQRKKAQETLSKKMDETLHGLNKALKKGAGRTIPARTKDDTTKQSAQRNSKSTDRATRENKGSPALAQQRLGTHTRNAFAEDSTDNRSATWVV